MANRGLKLFFSRRSQIVANVFIEYTEYTPITNRFPVESREKSRSRTMRARLGRGG